MVSNALHQELELAGCSNCEDGGTDEVDITIVNEVDGHLFCMKCEHEWNFRTGEVLTPTATDAELHQILADAGLAADEAPPIDGAGDIVNAEGETVWSYARVWRIFKIDLRAAEEVADAVATCPCCEKVGEAEAGCPTCPGFWFTTGTDTDTDTDTDTSITLYSCDNGAIYCAAHLGATAKATGKDISGQSIVVLTAADVTDALAQHGVVLRCEQCGAEYACSICGNVGTGKAHRDWHVENVVRAFVKDIRRNLNDEELVEADRLNKTAQYAGACATHDFIDANESMAEACAVEGMPAWSDPAVIAVWNEAWDIAKLRGFTRRAPRSRAAAILDDIDGLLSTYADETCSDAASMVRCRLRDLLADAGL